MGSKAGKAIISAGVFESFANNIPKHPTTKEAKNVARAKVCMFANSIKKNLNPWPIAAKIAVKNSVLMGGLQAYAKAKPVIAAKNTSLSSKFTFIALA